MESIHRIGQNHVIEDILGQNQVTALWQDLYTPAV